MDPLPEFRRHLGTIIRTNRKRLAISQTVLAERAAVTRRFIQEIENGRSDVSLQTLFRLAAGLEMTLTDICSQLENVMRAEQAQVFSL
jgi:transcriptional regulator with XRE-family HTH domain